MSGTIAQNPNRQSGAVGSIPSATKDASNPARTTNPPSPPAELPSKTGSEIANMSVFISFYSFSCLFFFFLLFLEGLLGTSGSSNGISSDGVNGTFSCEIASWMLCCSWLVL